MTNQWQKYIKLTNIGPLVNVSIDLNGLTVIIGPNSSGKSTIATMIFILKRTIERELYQISTESIPEYVNGDPEMVDEKETNLYNDIVKMLDDIETDRESVTRIFEQVSDLFRRIMLSRQDERNNILGQHFRQAVTDTLQDKLPKIIRSGQETAEIDYADELYQLKLTLTKPDKWVDINIDEIQFNNTRIVEKCRKHMSWSKMEKLQGSDNREDIKQLISIVSSLFAEIVGKNDLLYLPPGRAVISQNYNTFSSMAIDDYKKSLPSTITSYLKSINQSIGSNDKNRQKSASHEKFFLEKLFKGKISSTPGIEDRIYFNQTAVNTPIQRSASMIQDLVGIPLILFGERKYNLIIEEPEAHLHPDNQLVFAQWLTAYTKYLIKHDMKPNILVTTHSPKIIGQIENIIAASNIRDKTIHQLYEEFILLNGENIRLYQLVETQEGGYETKMAKTIPEGFEGDVFGSSSKTIYNDYAKIVALQNREDQ